MLEDLIPMTLFVTLFGMIGYVTRVISDNRVKRELVSMNADKETIDYLFLRAPEQSYENNLKWGIVIVAIGVAFGLMEVLGLNAEQPMTYALLFVFSGGGLLGFYALKAKSGDS